MDTIFPRDHDIPFDFMVTGAGIYQRVDGRLVAVDAADAQAATSQRLR